MHIADDPATGYITHDVFHRFKGFRRIGFVVHDQENASDDLNHQHQQGQGAEDVPEVEVLGCKVLTHVDFVSIESRGHTILEPVGCLLDITGIGRNFFEFSHCLSLVSCRSAGWVKNAYLGVRHIFVDRHFQVIRRRFVFEDAASQVKG